MNLAHTLMMTELMLKIIDDTAATNQPTTTMENPLMSEQHSGNSTTITASLDVSPSPSITASGTDGQDHPLTNSNVSVLLSPDATTHGDTATTIPTPNTVETTALLQNIMRLADVLEKHPDIFEFLKTLVAAPPTSAAQAPTHEPT